MIHYGKQSISEKDVNSVAEVLNSDFLTTGPKVKEFEEKVAKYVGSKYAVAVSSGTAALHLACLAAGLSTDDELITSPMTFAASANCALYCEAKPVFVDVDKNGLIDASLIENQITDKTKIIIPVHYAGFVCDMDSIKKIADKHGLIVIEDACHAAGGNYPGGKVGNCKQSDMSIFSFHPVKNMTTGEGGMITTNSKELYDTLCMLRHHGITRNPDSFKNPSDGPWYHEMQQLGFNYRITDFQCALGISQLESLENFVAKRRKIATRYNAKLKEVADVEIVGEGCEEGAYHLYVIKVADSEIRLALYEHMKSKGIYCNVHYIPVYRHPYYESIGYAKGLCPKSEEFYDIILSIPMYIDLTEAEQDKVVLGIKEFFEK